MNIALQIYNYQGPIDTIAEPTAATIGVFDGVHCGHRALISHLSTLTLPTTQPGTAPQSASEAPHSTLSPLVVTLTSHPSFVLGRRASEYWLDDPDEHMRMLFEAGAQYVAVMPFTADVARLTACQMARMLFERLGMRALLLGYDSRFGSKHDDDFAQLPLLASKLGFGLHHGEPCTIDGSPISSSRIRESLLGGDVGMTASLLGRPYSISGIVQHGRGVGHTLGFPTANISLDSTRKMLPKDGVYAVKVVSSQWSAAGLGMANLGAAPTFGVEKTLLEVHLLDFEGDLYGQRVEVQFIHRLRDITQFSSTEALQRQLRTDMERCRQI